MHPQRIEWPAVMLPNIFEVLDEYSYVIIYRKTTIRTSKDDYLHFDFLYQLHFISIILQLQLFKLLGQSIYMTIRQKFTLLNNLVSELTTMCYVPLEGKYIPLPSLLIKHRHHMMVVDRTQKIT